MNFYKENQIQKLNNNNLNNNNNKEEEEKKEFYFQIFNLIFEKKFNSELEIKKNIKFLLK